MEIVFLIAQIIGLSILGGAMALFLIVVLLLLADVMYPLK